MRPQQEVITTLREKAAAEAAAYGAAAPDERPLSGYLGLLGIYSLYAGLLAFLLRRLAPSLPERIEGRDLALLALATHKVSRMASKDAVLSPLRAYFTAFGGRGGPGEVNEEARGEGFRHAAGELVTCPFCLAQWVATLAVFSYLVAPRATRLVAGVFGVVAGSDLLQLLYAIAEQRAEEPAGAARTA